jgi:hypothetical protein
VPQRVKEGKLVLTFPDGWKVTKYDDWAFYQNQVGNRFGSTKAIDFLAYNPADGALWLIEIKDFRQHHRDKTKLPLWDEIGLKARDTLAGVFAAKVNGSVDSERQFAAQAMKASALLFVLHLEQAANHTKLFPRDFDPAKVQQELKQILKPISPHPKVIELRRMLYIPWQAHSSR